MYTNPHGQHQLDHLRAKLTIWFIDAGHVSDLLDVRSYRGGTVDSDRYPLIAGMRARISNIEKIRGERTRKFCIPKLQDENTANVYAKRLEECLKQLPGTGGETIQEEWDLCKSTIHQVAVLGMQASQKRNELFDEDRERVTKKEIEAYPIMQQQHGTRNKVLRYQEKRREEKKIHNKRTKLTTRNILLQKMKICGS
jgi:hypothetical protein